MDIFITPRLTIRPPLDVDGDALVAHLNDPKVTCNLRPIPKPYRAEDAAAYMRQIIESDDQQGYVLVRERAIGMIGLRARNPKTKTAHLGYWLAANHQGKGLMTEALNKVLHELFQSGWVNTIESSVAVGNLKAARLQQGLGFVIDQKQPADNGTILQSRLTKQDFYSHQQIAA